MRTICKLFDKILYLCGKSRKMNTFHYKKAVHAITFLAQLEGGLISYMKAIKLIWLSDRYHLRNHGRTITGDVYFAMKDGPVASCSYDLLKSDSVSQNLSAEELEYRNIYLVRSKTYSFKVLQIPEISMFSKSEVNTLHLIYKEFGKFDQFELSEMSHSFPEWQSHEKVLAVTKKQKSVQIDMMLFFKNVDNKLFSNTPEEIEEMVDYSTTFFPQMIHCPR